MNWAALSAIGSLVAAFVAAYAAGTAIWLSNKNAELQRQAAAVDLWWRIDERFSSPHIVTFRQEAAEAILRQDYESPAIDEMLDFFEFVGGLERRKLVSAEMVWHSLFNWVRAYWITCSGLVARTEAGDPEAWADFGRLYHVLNKIEQKDAPNLRPYTEDDAREMFRSEIAALHLLSKHRPTGQREE